MHRHIADHYGEIFPVEAAAERVDVEALDDRGPTDLSAHVAAPVTSGPDASNDDDIPF